MVDEREGREQDVKASTDLLLMGPFYHSLSHLHSGALGQADGSVAASLFLQPL